jgi:hypothetical protein
MPVCDVNEGSKNWLCSIFGHQHKRSGFGWVQAVPDYCVRCFANSVTKQGDDVLWCKIFGHKNRFEVVGDYDGHSYTGAACWNCHAKV